MAICCILFNKPNPKPQTVSLPYGNRKSPVSFCFFSVNQENRMTEPFAAHLKKHAFSNFLRVFVTIESLRHTLNMTQSTFAALMGVSQKTVEAWEAGTNVPLGTARRMLGLLQSDNSIPVKYKIVS